MHSLSALFRKKKALFYTPYFCLFFLRKYFFVMPFFLKSKNWCILSKRYLLVGHRKLILFFAAPFFSKKKGRFFLPFFACFFGKRPSKKINKKTCFLFWPWRPFFALLFFPALHFNKPEKGTLKKVPLEKKIDLKKKSRPKGGFYYTVKMAVSGRRNSNTKEYDTQKWQK